MRLFIYESACAGGLGPESPLRGEGWAMLAAVATDFARVEGVTVTTLLEHGPLPDLGHVCLRTAAADEASRFQELADGADKTLVIAPESDGLLEARSRSACRLLGSAPEAVALTGDKLALSQHWQAHGVPTPELGRRCPAVCKPRHGAGSQATFLVRDESDWPDVLRAARAESSDELIAQAHVAGQAVSVSLLIGPAGMVPLPPAEQRISSDGRFRYEGGRAPLPGPLAQRAQRLALAAVADIEGLAGWVGVDLVLADTGDVALEVNPRLTTSYVGLRRLCRGNLAEAWLRVHRGDRPRLDWHEGEVQW